MSRFDEELDARPVSEPRGFRANPTGPLMAAPILRDGIVQAYLFRGVDSKDSDAAGVVSRRDEDWLNHGVRHWFDELAARKREGLDAKAAVEALLGVHGPTSSGDVAPTLQEFDDKTAIDRELNGAARATPLRHRPTGDGVPADLPATRMTVDAVLRGEISSTPQIADAIAQLDAALDLHPTTEDLMVTVPLSAKTAAALTPDARVHERAYLQSLLATKEVVGASPATLILRVPAGTPALLVSPPEAAGPTVLLLARGLVWVVREVLRDGPRTVVFGAVVARQAER